MVKLKQSTFPVWYWFAVFPTTVGVYRFGDVG